MFISAEPSSGAGVAEFLGQLLAGAEARVELQRFIKSTIDCRQLSSSSWASAIFLIIASTSARDIGCAAEAGAPMVGAGAAADAPEG